jgi:hypothetical protein
MTETNLLLCHKYELEILKKNVFLDTVYLRSIDYIPKRNL